MTSIQFVDDPVGSHVKQIGKGHPIIMLHDFLGPDICWQGLETSLAEHYQIYFTILPGFLPEDSFSLIHPPEHIKFIHSLFSYYNIKSAILIGAGMGANLAIQFSAQYPNHVKGLVLIHPSGLNTIPNGINIPFSQLFFEYFILNKNKAFRKYLEKNEVIDMSDTDLLPSANCIKKAIKHYYIRKYSTFENLESIKTLMLLIWGRKNRFIPIKYAYELQGHLNSVQLSEYPDNGYDILKTNKTDIFNTIHQYIKFRLKTVTHMP